MIYARAHMSETELMKAYRLLADELDKWIVDNDAHESMRKGIEYRRTDIYRLVRRLDNITLDSETRLLRRIP